MMKLLTEMTVSDLMAIESLAEVLELEHKESKKYSDELGQLHEKAMTSAQRQEKRRELNDATRNIHRVVHVWRKLHKPEDAGPDQGIDAVSLDVTPVVGEEA